jgi:hypothetical protein
VVSIDQLRDIIERLHSCKAQWRDSAQVEEFGDQAVWGQRVYIFDIQGHPKTNTCYAWASSVEHSSQPKFHAVLAIPPVTTAADAVRAALVHD